MIILQTSKSIFQHCKIGPMCEVLEGECVPDYTVIFGKGLHRIDKSGVEELKVNLAARQAEVMRKLLPSNLSKFQ